MDLSWLWEEDFDLWVSRVVIKGSGLSVARFENLKGKEEGVGLFNTRDDLNTSF